ncbi:hypothetical protein H8B06_02285 [Sphingobacterium sp. DN00404]|uniref:Uncharacterized protein n=1 Tax=Sphingobacterium micropteri TaxID=2763501 RepID=A0ABR7YJZ6_9SPHI|nr:hypothetical protein [Sphingobacterium micropteri]MBD1431640.1 hypothetical protein [Sphingobacterium micropteri]
MKTLKKHVYIASILILITWLMTGLAVDDEFYEAYHIFLKHRPTGQYYFRSPLAMQDMPPDYPADKAAAYYTYREFVLEKHWSSEWNRVALLLVLGTAFYIGFVLVKAMKVKKTKV